MHSFAAPATPDPHPEAGRGWPVGLWLAGMLASFYPTLLSGFRLVQGGLGDSRLVNFTLEHSYRWLTGLPLAGDLLSPPIFYPARGVALFTDLLLGVAPLYWPWRWLGADPHTAYQLWMLACWSLNFVAAYLLLRRLGQGRIGAGAGAYLFAFASPRLASIVHEQLIPQFFLVLSLLAAVELIRSSRDPDCPPARLWWWSAALALGPVLQLATAGYALVFFEIGAAAALAAMIAVGDGRAALGRVLRRAGLPLLVCGVLAVALATPLAVSYWRTALQIGMRAYSAEMLPRPLSWVLVGDLNLLYGRVHRLPALGWAAMSPHHNGVGLVTLAVAGAGLWLGRRRREVQLAVVVVAVLAVLTLRMPGDWSLWRWVREVVPGAAALRAVGRVGAAALYPAALGLAVAADRVARRSRWLLVLLMVGVAAEQLHRPWTYDKAAAQRRVAEIAARVPSSAAAFLLVGHGPGPWTYLHDDAPWVALAAGVPTVNGRYGNRPRFWRLRHLGVETAEDRRRLRERLDFWCRKRGLDPAAVAWIEVDHPSP